MRFAFVFFHPPFASHLSLLIRALRVLLLILLRRRLLALLLLLLLVAHGQRRRRGLQQGQGLVLEGQPGLTPALGLAGGVEIVGLCVWG